MRDVIGILHLEDSNKDIELIRTMIESAGICHNYFLAEDRSKFLKILDTENVDIILSDYSLPGFKGNEALRVVAENYPHIPFIFVSGTIGEDAAINSMLNGATDYVLKHKLDRLIPAIKRALREQELEMQRKQAEKLLLESQELLQKARELAKMGVWNWNLHSGAITWTEELFQIAGMDPNLPAPTFEEQSSIFTPASWHLLKSAVLQSLRSGASCKLELELLRPDGHSRDIILFGAATTGSNGEITNLYGTAQDITERKMAERELIKAKEKAEESDRLKSSFLANISHEIRTPMSGILGFAELLKEPTLSEQELHTFIGFIEESGARMLNILNDIMDISKIESGQIEVSMGETNIHKQLENIYQLFISDANEKGIQLVLKNVLLPKEFFILTDQAKFHSILRHLLNNAIKFTKNGSVEFGYTVRSTRVPARKNSPAADNFGSMFARSSLLEFYVKDSGIGICKERFEEIFKRFIQVDTGNNRSFQGAGLGLSISKAYVELLGGKIWVKSREGAGSTFYFTIPCHALNSNKKTRRNLSLTEAC